MMKPKPHTETAVFSDTRRMHLRGLILVAGEIAATYWPMGTFVHHNPLHGLEDLQFTEAVRIARERLGGSGYLSNSTYRDYLAKGRIQRAELDAALAPMVENKTVTLGDRPVTHAEIMRSHLVHGASAPAEDTIESVIERHEERDTIHALADCLIPMISLPDMDTQMKAAVDGERSALGRSATLSDWCDRMLGTTISERINREMIKWCGAFFDEGHAAWPMPGREKGFFSAWHWLAKQEWSPCGIAGSRRKLSRLPTRPDDALLDSLDALRLPTEAWPDYLSRHIAALPGWAGFIKWRSDHSDYSWQHAYPVDLLQYLAVRIWYERELVQQSCNEALGIENRGDGFIPALLVHMEAHPHRYYLKRERGRGHLPAAYAASLDRLRYTKAASTETERELAERYASEFGPRNERTARLAAAWRLITLSRALGLKPALLLNNKPEDLQQALEWLDAFPETEHGRVWLEAFETGYREKLLDRLNANLPRLSTAIEKGRSPARHQAQAVFCIDVRSESFRRYLETVGDYETFGFAGFFTVFIRFRALGDHHDTDQFPVIMQAKNAVREVARTYHSQRLFRRKMGSSLLHAGHALLHDLKENVVTPYVAVESLGWFYSLPFLGKTLNAPWYKRLTEKLRRLFVPRVATAVAVDKLSRGEVNEMLAAEQRSIIRRALEAQFGNRHLNLSLERLEYLRLKSLDEPLPATPPPKGSLSREEEAAFIEELRTRYRINQGGVFTRMERITRIGFTTNEQIFTVETALRMMGMVRNFARLVLLCGHGSTTDNNPFEAALDCGACGGNTGKPNARVLASIANKPVVREALAKRGIVIPPDTYFIAGQHDTTTDRVELFDLEEIPHTHIKDLQRLSHDLNEAGRQNSQERCSRFPEILTVLSPARAAQQTQRRSADWSEVRPEWGLSGNTAFVVGRREWSRGLDLEGRVFLHSYKHEEDTTGRLLEIVLTGPQIVAQWINMEHYFSTVDPEVYGSGSKIYHNVVGRFGVMSGPQGDLRTGLAWQTVMNGPRPYHEPMRLLTIVEAPRERITRIIHNHRVLQHLYHYEWVRLVALDPDEQIFYNYHPIKGWTAGPSHGKVEP